MRAFFVADLLDKRCLYPMLHVLVACALSFANVIKLTLWNSA
jgi:hypothetical protein